MGLLAPWFLAGLAGAALPVFLHLLRQYRATPRPFSSLLFFDRRPQASVKHRRLKYYALLAARLALLVLLVLAFAQPFFNQAVPVSSGKRLLVIAIDRSFSMRARGHFAQARAAAERTLDSASPALSVTVLAVDSLVETLAAPEIGKEAAHAAISSIAAVDRASSFGEFARSLRILAQNTGMQLDVHFFSDLQATSLPPSFADIDPGPQASLTLHSVAEAREPNWAVESVTAPARVYKEHARVVSVIKGWQTEAAARRVSLFLDGRLAASQQATIPANGRAPVEFLGIEIPYGAHRGEVRIEPHDDLPDDDAFPFSIERADPAPVLFLSSGRTRDAFYYQSALEAAGAGFNVQTSTVQASTSPQASGTDFSRYAFVAVADDGGLYPALETQLSAYVRRGGSLFVLAGAGTLLHSRVAVSGMAAHPSDRSVTGASVETQHPAVAGLSLDGVQFYRWLKLTPSPGARVLARLSDGSPLAVEEPQGEGMILTFASSFDNLANDFPLHSAFVPFVAQTARYLAHSEEGASSLVAGLPVELRKAKDSGAAADVIGPAGDHMLSFSEATTASVFSPPREGFYEVRRADGRRVLVAVHADRRESDLTPIPNETLSLWRDMGQSRGPVAAGAGAAANREARPYSLWRIVLIMALAAAFAESVLANSYWSGKRQEGSPS
jgi:hypothetical protein